MKKQLTQIWWLFFIWKFLNCTIIPKTTQHKSDNGHAHYFLPSNNTKFRSFEEIKMSFPFTRNSQLRTIIQLKQHIAKQVSKCHQKRRLLIIDRPLFKGQVMDKLSPCGKKITDWLTVKRFMQSRLSQSNVTGTRSFRQDSTKLKIRREKKHHKIEEKNIRFNFYVKVNVYEYRNFHTS